MNKKKIVSRAALEAWEEDEAIKEQARKDARIVSLIALEIEPVYGSLTEAQILAKLGELGELDHVRIYFTNGERGGER